jgi:hypothetical protein
VIKNTTTYGAQLTSLGDGADTSFWRQGGVWNSGNTSDTQTVVTTSLVNLTTTAVAGGFLTYLVLFNFTDSDQTGYPTGGAKVYADLYDGTTHFYSNVVGYTTSGNHATYSGSAIYVAPSIQPVTITLASKTSANSVSLSWAQLTVVGIN